MFLGLCFKDFDLRRLDVEEDKSSIISFQRSSNKQLVEVLLIDITKSVVQTQSSVVITVAFGLQSDSSLENSQIHSNVLV